MSGRRTRSFLVGAFLGGAAILLGGSATGQPSAVVQPHRPLPSNKVILRVYESTFNGLASAVGTLKLTGHYTYRVTACVPGTSICTSTEVCSSDWTATVTNLRFTISPSKIAVTGQGHASWCGVSTPFTLETTADVTKTSMLLGLPGRAAPRTEDAILVRVRPTDVQPVVNIPGYAVKLPIHFNVAPAFALPPIPLATSLVSFETAAGSRSLRLSPSQAAIAKRDHYLELQAGLRLW